MAVAGVVHDPATVRPARARVADTTVGLAAPGLEAGRPVARPAPLDAGAVVADDVVGASRAAEVLPSRPRLATVGLGATVGVGLARQGSPVQAPVDAAGVLPAAPATVVPADPPSKGARGAQATGRLLAAVGRGLPAVVPDATPETVLAAPATPAVVPGRALRPVTVRPPVRATPGPPGRLPVGGQATYEVAVGPDGPRPVDAPVLTDVAPALAVRVVALGVPLVRPPAFGRPAIATTPGAGAAVPAKVVVDGRPDPPAVTPLPEAARLAAETVDGEALRPTLQAGETRATV